MEGKIRKLLTSYGFIEIEGAEKDFFFHKSEAVSFGDLNEEDRVDFEIGKGKKGDQVVTAVEKIDILKRNNRSSVPSKNAGGFWTP